MKIKTLKTPGKSVLTRVGIKEGLIKTILFLTRRTGESRYPACNCFGWITSLAPLTAHPCATPPAFAGMMVYVLFLGFFNTVFAGDLEGPGLGVPASAKEISKWDIGVMSDGEGLPEGSGAPAQGKAVYEKYCISCHGPEGAGGTADPLAGAKMTLTSEYPEQTIGSYWPYATTLFDLTRRSMPMNTPGTLTEDEVYAVTAYLLYLNNIISEDDEMNAKTLPKVQMPNRDGFINVYELEKGKE
jgi:Cytochrome c